MDKSKLEKVISKIKPSTVIHLAAVSHDGKSNLFPEYAYKNSFETLFNTLDVIRSRKIHLIYFHQVWFMELLKKSCR